MTDTFRSDFDVAKVDDDRRLIFGWAMVAVRKGGDEVLDHQEDAITVDDLEVTAYDFVLEARAMGDMHDLPGRAVKTGSLGTLVESIVFTDEKIAALGLPADSVDRGWWVGFHVDDDDAWRLIKSGERTMFSIQGACERVAG